MHNKAASAADASIDQVGIHTLLQRPTGVHLVHDASRALIEQTRQNAAWAVLFPPLEHMSCILVRTAHMQIITSCVQTWEGIAQVHAARLLVRGAAFSPLGVALVKFLDNHDERRLSTQQEICKVMTWLRTHSIHIAYVSPGRLMKSWRELTPILPRLLTLDDWRQSASADFRFSKVSSQYRNSQYGVLVAVELPDGFALKAHGSFGAAPLNAIGETQLPVSFLRLRYLPVPSGYRKRSHQALERRAAKKLQRHYARHMQETTTPTQGSEAASAATASFECDACESVESSETPAHATEQYILGHVHVACQAESNMGSPVIACDLCMQVLAQPMPNPDQAAGAAIACSHMRRAGLLLMKLHMCQAITQAASAVVWPSHEPWSVGIPGAQLAISVLDYMSNLQECTVFAYVKCSHCLCPVAILTQRSTLALSYIVHAASAATSSQESSHASTTLLLRQAASAALLFVEEGAGAAAQMAAAGFQSFTQYITAGLHVTSGGLLNLEHRKGAIAQLHNDYWSIQFSEHIASERMIVEMLEAENILTRVSTCVDCCRLSDPRCFGHIGRHPDIVQGIGRHRQMQEVLAEVALSLQRLYHLAIEERARDEPRDNPRLRAISLLCKSGKHRSVCIAEFVAWQLGVEVTHLSSNYWPIPCSGRCTQCALSYANTQRLTRIFRAQYTPTWERLCRELGGPGLEQIRLLKNGGWQPHPYALPMQVNATESASAPPQPTSVPSSAHFVTDESEEDEIPEWAQAASAAVPHPHAASAAAASSSSATQAASAAAPRTPIVAQAASAASRQTQHVKTASAVTLVPRADVKEEVERRSRSASVARGSLPIEWQELSKPRKRGRILPMSSHVRAEFPYEWLFVRGLSGVLTRNHEQERIEQQNHYKGDEKGLRRWLIYDYNRRQEPVDPTWVQAFHGTWWYSLWSVLETGVMLESNDSKLGHDFWEPGTYVTPLLETAMWYERPHVVFMDGVYQRAVIELRVDKKRIKRERERGGIQWVFPSDAVKIVGFRFKTNAPPRAPEQRFDTWEQRLEAMPDHHALPHEFDRHNLKFEHVAHPRR
eukprot:1298730-Amphidinium_carterae.1